MLIFLKRNKIQRVTCSHFQAFSKLRVRLTWGLLYHSSLKIYWSHKLGSFPYRSFAGLSTIFKFSHSKQIWGLQSIYWAFLKVTHLEMVCKNWIPSSSENWVQIWSLATQICEKVKKNYFGACTEWGLHCHRMLSGKSRNYAVSLMCNITQIWQLLSVNTRNIIHLAM